MSFQALHPGKFVVIFRPGCRIAVRKIEPANAHWGYGARIIRRRHHQGFNIARLLVCIIARQAAHHIIEGMLGEKCHAVIRFLPMNLDVVAAVFKLMEGEFFIHAFDFLQDRDIGRGFIEPFENTGQAGIDRVDVECGKFHEAGLSAICFTRVRAFLR